MTKVAGKEFREVRVERLPRVVYPLKESAPAMTAFIDRAELRRKFDSRWYDLRSSL